MTPDTPTKTQRLLDLLAFLVSRHQPVSRGEIWDGVVGYRQKLEGGAEPESVRRGFERDKEELLALGFPLETVDVPRNDPEEQILYRIRAKNFYLPYLRLIRDDGQERAEPDCPDLPGDEVRMRPKRSWQTRLSSLDPESGFAAADALHTLRSNPELPFQAEADSAFRKLTFDLQGDLGGLFGPAPVLVPADDEDTRDLIPVLARAVRQRRVVRFAYHGIDRDAVTAREVEPWSLLYKQSRWYLLGHDRTRDDRRIFRLSRIRDTADGVDGPPEFDPPDLDLSAWDDADAWNLPGMDESPVEAVVRFRFPRSLWADRNDVGELLETDPETGDTLRRFVVRSSGPFVRWVLGQLDDARIVSPPELVEEAAHLRQRVIDANPTLFGGEEGDGGAA
jgi:predicted DNA-binding transcriptional regulator YafY